MPESSKGVYYSIERNGERIYSLPVSFDEPAVCAGSRIRPPRQAVPTTTGASTDASAQYAWTTGQKASVDAGTGQIGQRPRCFISVVRKFRTTEMPSSSCTFCRWIQLFGISEQLNPMDFCVSQTLSSATNTSTPSPPFSFDLNFGKVSTPSGDDVGVDNGVDKNTDLILNAIAEDSRITQKSMALWCC
ncbi:MAG: hypothetical protein LBH86_00235 [Oscillospiraceae bacterium]|jgi:hypothetical protein|nr:hypothetical protein [Oscillospiraceae bacterium]